MCLDKRRIGSFFAKKKVNILIKTKIKKSCSSGVENVIWRGRGEEDHLDHHINLDNGESKK